MRNRLFVITILSTLILSLLSCKDDAKSNPAQQDLELDTLEQKVSYTLGYYLSREISSAGMTIDLEATLKAIEDVRVANELMLTKEQMAASAHSFQEMQRELKAAELRQKSSKAGEQYMSENAKREGVSVTASGLQYEILNRGEGASPKSDDRLTVHYSGKLLDGNIFDSSVEGGEPVSFALQEVIPGWQEALAMMKVGDKWRVTLPPALAYPNGTREIPSGAVTVFELELIALNAE